MKEPMSTSPFAAKTPQELRHQWTVWQAQQDVTRPVANMPQSGDEAMPAEETPEPPQAPPPLPKRILSRHGQYDSILRRMKNAGQQATNYIPVDTVTQPASGSENAEK